MQVSTTTNSKGTIAVLKSNTKCWSDINDFVCIQIIDAVNDIGYPDYNLNSVFQQHPFTGGVSSTFDGKYLTTLSEHTRRTGYLFALMENGQYQYLRAYYLHSAPASHAKNVFAQNAPVILQHHHNGLGGTSYGSLLFVKGISMNYTQPLTLYSTANPLPHVQVTDVSEVTSGILTISGTVFSSVANIASVKAAVFDPDFDLEGADQAALADFVNTNGTDLSITSDQYAVGNVSGASLSSYFTDILSPTFSPLASEISYRVAMSAADITGNVGVGVNTIIETAHKLWRIRIATVPSEGIFDIQPNSSLADPHGLLDSSGNDLLANHNPDRNYVSLFNTISNRYTLLNNSDGVISSYAPSSVAGHIHDNWLTKDHDYRMHVMNEQALINSYILIGFVDGLTGSQIDSFNLISFAAGRPARIPVEMVIEYYTGVLENGVHDTAAWVTWATLTNTAQSANSPRWLNITKDATIDAIE